MEESQQPEQTVSTQDAVEVNNVAITSQPASAEQQTLPTATDEAKQIEEGKAMEHLTVISEDMETSKYNTCPSPLHESPINQSSTRYLLIYCITRLDLLTVIYHSKHFHYLPKGLDIFIEFFLL